MTTTDIHALLDACEISEQTYDDLDEDGQLEVQRAGRMRRAVEAALKVADDGEHGALRWEHPLPVPEYVHLIRHAITAALTEETP